MNQYETMMEKHGRKPKPILFNTEMTRAFKENRKNQTRRNPFFFKFLDGFNPEFTGYTLGEYSTGSIESGVVLYSKNRGCWRPVTEIDKPPYVPGDILYVRETWQESECFDYDIKGQYCYRADLETEKFAKEHDIKWRPSIFMPKKAARLFAIVTGVRAERIKNTTEEEAMAEGVNGWTKDGSLYKYGTIAPGEDNSIPWAKMKRTAIEAFADLWNELYQTKGYGWDMNPWIWVIELEKLEVI